MARIIGGIGSSHAPSIAHAYDKGWHTDPEWKPLFDGYAPAKQWLAQMQPDVMVIFYNDHLNRFFFDAYPTFAIGVGAKHALADEGWGLRNFPAFDGAPELAWHVTKSLVEQEFDITVCQEIEIDHGILSPLPMLTDTHWPAPIIPIPVNVIQHPLPSARRCYKLGQALRRAVESFPQDLKVMVLGTGGLSHQLNGKRFGFINPEWDHEFMTRLVEDPVGLTDLGHDELMRRGGVESVEMIIWLAMRGALSAQVRRAHQAYYAPSLTGYGLLALEDLGTN